MEEVQGRSQLFARLTQLREQVGAFLLLPDLAGKSGKELRAEVQENGQTSPGYMLMCAISAGIAMLGMLQGSTAVVIGAMLVSPLMSPIVALGFGFASLDGKRIKDAARVVMVGAAIGIVVAVLLTGLSPIRSATPEIIARTEPSLLDLLVALLSGVAGGYAVVKRLGATAIGVAIATALMPPIATVGYGIAVWRLDFAGGALLLFLTNLAAIAFAITLVARLSGAARPLSNVEKNPYFLIAGLAAFLSLATPLGLTLARLSNESVLRNASQDVLSEELGIDRRNITQLDISWPLTGDPEVNAIVIAPKFREDGEEIVLAGLTKRIGEAPAVNLQQIVAADGIAETRAIVDAAIDSTKLILSNDVPPYEEIRAAIGVPVQSIWPNRSERTVDIVTIAVDGWTLKDYYDVEELAQSSAGVWNVRIIPPAQQILTVEPPRLTSDDVAAQNDDAIISSNRVNPAIAIWAIERWGLREVTMDRVVETKDQEDESSLSVPKVVNSFANIMERQLRSAGIKTIYNDVENNNQDGSIRITTYGLKPSQRVK